jgi:hypothetical protein
VQDFNTNQAQLAKARAVLAVASSASAQAAELQRRLTQQLAQLSRTLNPKDRAGLEQKAALENQLEQATADAQAKQAAVQNARQAATAALEGFATFTDPRTNLAALSDALPFLLFPVRVETRFKTSGEPPQSQLWVRIYPDDCSIDTFEDTFSAAELANAKLYWQAIWRAGGIEGDQRAAWSNLVAAHGSGRASWIVDHYQPSNLAAEPVKAAASDEILVIPTQTPLPTAQATAISVYWQAVWLANGDNTKSHAALTALQGAVGAATASDLIQNYAPYNMDDEPTAPTTKSDVALSTAFVIFPPDPATKQDSWSQAPVVNHLADRFVVIGYNGGVQTLQAIGGVVSLPLSVGPNPAADPSETIHPQGGDLVVPDELQWLVDFDRAVAAGMGLRIDLTADQAQTGFDRLIVLGVEFSSKDSDAKSAVELLLQHHNWGRSGLSLVPQGTPTHNTTGAGTGYTPLDNANQSFDDRKNAPLFTLTADPLAKRDGQWLAELLGIDPAILQTVHASDGTDQILARAAQCALWPATLGYWLDKLLTPIFSDATLDNTRWFFTSFVSGRGAVPAIRIGDQAYGILPTTAFSRMRWDVGRKPITGTAASPSQVTFLGNLWQILRKLDADWTLLSAQASYVGKAGDAHQLLLDIIGLHPASIEFYSRYAESLSEIFNIIQLWGLGPDFWTALTALATEAGATQLLAKLGYSGTPPDILQHVFFSDAAQIGTVIDDRPLSETSGIRAYTDDGRNYIQWLIDAAKTSLDAVYQEQGFTANKTPEALLYLYLRQALMLGYYDSSYNLHKSAAFLTAAQLQAMKPEPKFVHVAAGAAASESRFAALYKTEPRITSSNTMLVSDYITTNLATLADTAEFNQQLACLGILAGASTAALERVFAEHIDCCSYRYDAWLLGLVNSKLQSMRYLLDGQTKTQTARTGLYLGAYAWLEDLRPSTAKLTPVLMPGDIVKNFPGTTPLLSDATNGGYIHAPSLPHAETAAVLRSGYLANATPSNPGTMSVNLSSDRVRLALSTLEGIRNGQSLGALLGYQFETGLHDDFGLTEVDQFIYPMRKAFPLVADAIAETKTDPTVPIEAIEASNVLDGLKLVTQIRNSGISSYPFGVTLPAANSTEAAAITAQAAALLDLYDAIADLALAEGVHQAVQGNFERIAATLDAYTSGNFPPDPEVVQTPPSGIGLTHRVGVHFTAGLPPQATATPRAMAEPALDAWLASLLPAFGDIQCKVVWKDPVSGANQTETVSLQNLAVSPIDLLDLLKPDSLQSMTELDDRIMGYVITKDSPRPDAVLSIQYMASNPGKFSIFQTLALLRSLKALVVRSRPLQATDAMLNNSASPQANASVFVDSTRITMPKTALDQLGADIGTFLGTLAPLTTNPTPANQAAIVAGIDGFLNSAVALLDRAARFNISLSGWGFAFAWKQSAFVDLFASISALVTRWTQKLADYDAKIAAYDALPAATTDTARFQALSAAELDIATTLDPLPADPATMRIALDAKRATFSARLAQFQAVLNAGTTSFATALTNAQAIPTSDLDSQAFDLSTFQDRAVVFATDLVTNLTGHQTDITNRSADVQTQLDAYAAAAAATDQVAALQAAAKALLGSDFRIYPEFSLSASQGDEWANAIAASTGGTLLQYLTTTAKLDFPVDEWLYGVARIRPNMHSWEQLLMLTSAFGVASPVLVPAQFPYESAPSWVALQYPDSYVLDSDRLLYTAQYVAPFDKTSRQCGMLIDEWTEVIPATTRTTGIAFNYNRPNNEASQCFLLVTPATGSGTWVWDDLLGAVNETLDLAKKRAVEPVQLDATPYSCFLPATVMAVTYYGISITTSLAAANGVFRYLESSTNA